MKKRVARKVISYGVTTKRGRYSTLLRAITRDPEYYFWIKWYIRLSEPGIIRPRG